jgi:molybdopterin molybdotransferase
VLKPSLVTVEQAREAVLADLRPLGAEPVELRAALGRVIAQAATVPADIPPFDNSAMDGYAVRAADAADAGPHAPVELELVGESRAGHPAPPRLGSGQAVAISTGAAVPRGADSVIRLEDTRPRNGRVALLSAPRSGLNIRRAGEDLRSGDVVVEPGTVIGPAELGVLSSLGDPTVVCRRRPRVSLVITGDELKPPGRPLSEGRIYDTNSYSVAALARLAGAELTAVERVPDRPKAIKAALGRSLGGEIVVACGGVSIGPHDYVRGALTELGVRERFWGVALKPGKPTWFGVREDEGLVFGLPGNPVSAMITFLLLVRPALLALAGASADRPRTTAALDETYMKEAGRAHAVRCRLRLGADGWHLRPTKDQASHVLSSMLGADCLALIPTDAEILVAGSRVEIELLPEAPLGGCTVER